MRRTFLILVVAGFPAFAMADPSGHQKSSKTPDTRKLLPLKGAARGSACAEYGAGFVKVDGTDTCVKLGGSVSRGVGAYMGAR